MTESSRFDPFAPPTLINRAVLSIEAEGVVARSAGRRYHAAAESIFRQDTDRFDAGENMLYTLNRYAWRLEPFENDVSIRFDQYSVVDVIGFGSRELDDTHQHRFSRMTPAAVADLVAPMLPEVSIARLSLIGSFVDSAPASAQGVLTGGFMFDFIRALEGIVGSSRMPASFSAELADVGIAVDGRIRSAVDLEMANHGITPIRPAGRSILVVEPNADGQPSYTLQLAFDRNDSAITGPQASSLRWQPGLQDDTSFTLLSCSSRAAAFLGKVSSTSSPSGTAVTAPASFSPGDDTAANATGCDCYSIPTPDYVHDEF